MIRRRTSRSPTRQAVGALAWCLAAALVPAAAVADEARADAGFDRLLRLGEQVYRTGVLPDGRPLEAVIGRDVEIRGVDAACANCHRRSGWGSSEGTIQAPPVTASVLSHQLTIGHPGLPGYREQGPGTRAPYSASSLARAIRDGVDSSGRPLRAPMPRYDLDQDAMDSLVAYLGTLGEQVDPGVDDTTIALATIIAGPVAEERRHALLGVLHAFADGVNAEVRNQVARRDRGSWLTRRTYAGYRSWKLVEWRLDGPPSGWSEQLERLYEQEPVFAVLSGVGEGTWQPVHDFCDENRLPCLFPITDQPGADAPGGYSFYFSRGAALEGEAVARQLVASLHGSATILQLYPPQGRCALAAHALDRALADTTGLRVVGQPVGKDPAAARLVEALDHVAPDVVVLWLEPEDLAAFGPAVRLDADVPVILPSWSVATPLPDVVRNHPGRVLATFPYSLPDDSRAGRDRALFWIRARGLEVSDVRLQTGAFFAASIIGDALRELRGRFSREYLMENVEHMVDRSVVTSVYPTLSLAPGQRFATTRCAIVDLDSDPDGAPRLAEISSWIVP